jgi:hypothetical protein
MICQSSAKSSVGSVYAQPYEWFISLGEKVRLHDGSRWFEMEGYEHELHLGLLHLFLHVDRRFAPPQDGIIE